MKQLFILANAVFLFSACTSPSVIVRNKKEPTRPYTRILAVYLEEGCDFSLFDSTAYNICLRSCFLKTESFGLRSLVETRIQKHLRTSGTRVLQSSDLFDAYNCDYAYFRRCIDSLGIDAILMVGLRSYSHDEHETPATLPDRSNNYTYTPGQKFKTLNAFFVCDLINTKSLYIPVWRAEIEEKGKRYVGENGLNRSMTKKLAESLKGSHYIAH